MVKWFLRSIFIVAVSLGISYLPQHFINNLYKEDFLTTAYTVIGIMFALGLNQIMSFSFTEVEREAFVNRYRGDLDKARNIFVWLFIISTIVFALKFINFSIEWNFFKFDIRCFHLVFLVFCIIYYVINFITLSDLKMK